MKKNLTVLIVIVALIEIVEIILTVFVIRGKILTSLVSEFNQRQLATLRTTANALDEELLQITTKLKIAADLPEVESGKEVCNQKLTQLYPYFQNKVDNLFRLNTKAVIICAYNQKTIGADLNKELPYFKKLLEDKNHPAVMGRKRISPATNFETIGIHVPVFQNGQFTGTLSTAIYTDQIGKNYLDLIIDPLYNHVYLVDDNSDILYHKGPFEIKKESLIKIINQATTNKEGEKRYFIDNTDYSFIYSTINAFPDRHWYLIEVVSSKDIFNKIEGGAEYQNNIKVSSILSLVIFLSIITGTSLLIIYLNKENR